MGCASRRGAVLVGVAKATCRWMGRGTVLVGVAKATCRWAGRELCAPEPTSRLQGSRVQREAARPRALARASLEPRCAVYVPRSLWQPCHSQAGSGTWRRLQRPQSHLDLACFPLMHRGPRPHTASHLGGASLELVPGGQGCSQGWKMASVCGRWTRPTPGEGRPCRAVYLSPDSPVLQRSSNGQCRPAVKSVTRASGL